MQERREIESALHDGDLWAVAATNALELGVDVGSLDVTLHLGFPGTAISLCIELYLLLFRVTTARHNAVIGQQLHCPHFESVPVKRNHCIPQSPCCQALLLVASPLVLGFCMVSWSLAIKHGLPKASGVCRWCYHRIKLMSA